MVKRILVYSLRTRKNKRCIHRSLTIHHEPHDKTCTCGCQLTRIGEDVSEKLDYIPGVARVERHIRGKWTCKSCETLTQAPVPEHIIDKGIATTGLLAHVLVAKYSDNLPSYPSTCTVSTNLYRLDGFISEVCAAWLHSLVTFLCVTPEIGAVCGNSARTGVCRGYQAIGIPTATPKIIFKTYQEPDSANEQQMRITT